MHKVLRRFVIPACVVGGIVLVLALTTPHAAHAVEELLVHVSNTPLRPAITQDVSRLASSQITLQGSIGLGAPGTFNQFTSNGRNPITFQVPADKSLVITSVDVFTPGGGGGFADLISTLRGNTVDFATWSWPTTDDAVTLQFQYPNGLVFAPNSIPIIGGEAPANQNINVNLYGYLTAN
jgi:hypothetical protein